LLHSGAALNEGRELYPEDDKGFGLWKQDCLHGQLARVPELKEEQAAMWASGHPEDDKGFGLWKQREIYSSNLLKKPVHEDEIAAMWAAGHPEYRTVPRLVGVPATCWNGRHGSLPPTCRLKTIMTASQRCGVATRDTKSNAQFGQWVRNNLLQTENYMDRAAASGVRQVATDGSSRTSVRYVASQLAGPRSGPTTWRGRRVHSGST